MIRLLDLHVHPSLKMHYLPFLRNTFHSKVFNGDFWNPLSFRTQYGKLKNSPEKVMLCAHYVIEKEFVAKGIHKPFRGICWGAAPFFYGGLRFADPWKTLMKMMKGLEKSIPATNKKVTNGGMKLKMVKNFSELADLADDETAMIHAVEGSHALGYGPEEGQSLEAFWRQTLRRLKYLKECGVCMITLGHFWDNMFCPQTEGTEHIPKKKGDEIVVVKDDLVFNMVRAKWHWNDPDHLAEPFARQLLEMGILIDLSHCQRHARWEIYKLCEEYKRPVVASHVGLQHFFDHEYNFSDEEVLEIHRLGGIVGLILSRRWLVDPKKRHGSDGKGIADLIENMLHIRDLCGDVSCIGIGTDLDGLTDPFKDCYTADHLGRIAEAMKPYFSDDEIDQILFRNGMRVLEKGWD